MIILQLLLLVAGFAALVKGADFFVDGSSALARNFRVPALVIGLTIVAFGTSAPELAVSTAAALQGSNEIALSNVIGSNIFNLLMVLGICAAIRPVPVEGSVLKKDFPVSFVPTLVLFFLAGGAGLFGGNLLQAGMAAAAGTVTRPMAAGLLILFAVYLWSVIHTARKNRRSEEESPESGFTNKKCALLILVGVAMIVAGGEAVVYSAKAIAQALGMTETMIGLIVVATGTSLPELVTSLVASRKGETELALGNAVGSNIFNLLLILGVSAFIHPVAVNVASVCDLLILLGVTAMTWIFSCTGRRLARWEGAVMALSYAAVAAFAILR